MEMATTTRAAGNTARLLLEQNLLVARDAIVNWPPVEVESTMDEGGWRLAYAIKIK